CARLEGGSSHWYFDVW
nr:immunoglobulin heavy chain junction region [Mus musculus]